ncbi:MAG: glutamyl-tRNA reductase, partial [Verrucomicrobiota bacterium]
EKEVPAALRDLVSGPLVSEAVILNTCNRVELYAMAEEVDAGWEYLESFLLKRFSLTSEESVPFARECGLETVRHLFRVASGLESMVLGETEIFGQVKKAYSVAQAEKATAKRLNQLFQQSFRVGKHIRNNTQIQRGSTSVGSVAVDLAEAVFGRLKKCLVLLVGAGEMSRVVAQSLLSRGAESVIVSNRSFDKAEELAESIGGSAIRFDDWETRVKDVDIIISSTSAPHHVIREEHVRGAMRIRRGKPLIIIDIAVPRDVAPEVSAVPDVYLYPIDSLAQIASEGKRKRETQLRKCEQMITAYIEEYGVPAVDLLPAGESEDPGNAPGYVSEA